MSYLDDGLLRKPLKVACIQIASGPDKTQNLGKAREKILQAASEGARLIILPEYFNSPYSTAKFREYAEPLSASLDSVKSPSFVVLAQMAQDAGAFVVGGSVPECDVSSHIYNTCVVYSPLGELLAFHRKMHLFDINLPGGMSFHESDTLSAGKQITIVNLEGYGKIGLGICYDMRFVEPSTIAARRGAFDLVYPSAFNTTTGPLHWELLGRARAVDNQVYSIMCSQSRDSHSSDPAWGYSMVTDSMGRVIAGTKESEDIVYALLDPETIKQKSDSDSDHPSEKA
ncbi:nitrilase family protein-like protein [Aspergillus caelatus]|uniref:Nitrilase family protein-like protein n=1 Tax=Aspergillus caelatus TaxID=61420 RepID=A0A5N7A6V6_9EURO|nr:nitrilase family protein-like protein [Aspergillus caelatus]KAE8364270.1 nitrilase family protein-like protein [Aspergillus caelatus]